MIYAEQPRVVVSHLCLVCCHSAVSVCGPKFLSSGERIVVLFHINLVAEEQGRQEGKGTSETGNISSAAIEKRSVETKGKPQRSR